MLGGREYESANVRRRNGLQIAFAIENEHRKVVALSAPHHRSLSIGAVHDRPRSKKNKSRIDD